MPEWSDIVVTFYSSILILTPNGQFLGCVTVAFSERHVLKGVRGTLVVLGLSVSYTGLQCFRPSVARVTCGTRQVSWVLCTLLLKIFTIMAAIPLYLLLNKLHLFLLTQHSCVLGSIKRSLIINKHNGMAAIKPAVTIQYYSINRYTNLKRNILKFNLSIYFNKQCFNPLKTKGRLLYLKTQSVPRCKHFSSRL